MQQTGRGAAWYQQRPAWFRWTGYYALILIILTFGEFGRSKFIYFQF
jgi:hypothetical protein